MTTQPEDAMTRERARNVEAVAQTLCAIRGFGFYTDPMEGGQDAYDISCEALREAEALIKAYPALASAGEWRPIETAPKEPHSKYLGWCEFGDPRSPDGEARIVTLDYYGFPYAFGCKQTVRWWMPLPESPAARASGEKGGAR